MRLQPASTRSQPYLSSSRGDIGGRTDEAYFRACINTLWPGQPKPRPAGIARGTELPALRDQGSRTEECDEMPMHPSFLVVVTGPTAANRYRSLRRQHHQGRSHHTSNAGGPQLLGSACPTNPHRTARPVPAERSPPIPQVASSHSFRLNECCRTGQASAINRTG